jgi:hypothetical protein
MLQPLELEGHSKILRCMCFGYGSQPKFLCTAAEDYIIVWNIHQIRRAVDKGNKYDMINNISLSLHTRRIFTEVKSTLQLQAISLLHLL